MIPLPRGHLRRIPSKELFDWSDGLLDKVVNSGLGCPFFQYEYLIPVGADLRPWRKKQG